MRQLKLKVRIEVSDHDGYCSGEESSYSRKTKNTYIELPHEFEMYNNGDDISHENLMPYLKHLIPKINHTGSGYCNPCEYSNKYGLECHDYRITILSASVVDNALI